MIDFDRADRAATLRAEIATLETEFTDVDGRILAARAEGRRLHLELGDADPETGQALRVPPRDSLLGRLAVLRLALARSGAVKPASAEEVKLARRAEILQAAAVALTYEAERLGPERERIVLRLGAARLELARLEPPPVVDMSERYLAEQWERPAGRTLTRP